MGNKDDGPVSEWGVIIVVASHTIQQVFSKVEDAHSVVGSKYIGCVPEGENPQFGQFDLILQPTWPEICAVSLPRPSLPRGTTKTMDEYDICLGLGAAVDNAQTYRIRDWGRGMTGWPRSRYEAGARSNELIRTWSMRQYVRY